MADHPTGHGAASPGRGKPGQAAGHVPSSAGKIANAPHQPAPHAIPNGDDRRGFLGKFTAVTIGGLITLFPFLAGLATFFDPLRRASAGGRALRVGDLDSLPSDGTPRLFPVIADRKDAWNKFDAEPIGSVYVRLVNGQAIAFNSLCPHAGCGVGYDESAKIFQCPCHTSAFNLDGSKIEPSPSPRAMDTLACEIRDVGGRKEIWVTFQNFYPATDEQIAKP